MFTLCVLYLVANNMKTALLLATCALKFYFSTFPQFKFLYVNKNCKKCNYFTIVI